jgi:hypothetical protein
MNKSPLEGSQFYVSYVLDTVECWAGPYVDLPAAKGRRTFLQKQFRERVQNIVIMKVDTTVTAYYEEST